MTITGSPDLPVLAANRELLATLCIVSEVEIEPDAEPGGPGFTVDAEQVAARQVRAVLELPADGRPDAEHPTLCERCVRVVSDMLGRRRLHSTAWTMPTAHAASCMHWRNVDVNRHSSRRPDSATPDRADDEHSTRSSMASESRCLP